REELLVEGFGRAEREHRQMDHRGSPELAVRQGELEPQTAHGGSGVGRIGVAAPQRETAENRPVRRRERPLPRLRPTPLLRVTLIGLILASVLATFAYLGGWLTPNVSRVPDRASRLLCDVDAGERLGARCAGARWAESARRNVAHREPRRHARRPRPRGP